MNDQDLLVKENKPKTTPKNRKVFRNAGNRQYQLKRRPNQPENEKFFNLNPGDTVEAIDDQEEDMMDGFNELRDVAKETPALANNINELKAELEKAKKENEQLRADKAKLEDTLEDQTAPAPKSKK